MRNPHASISHTYYCTSLTERTSKCIYPEYTQQEFSMCIQPRRDIPRQPFDLHVTLLAYPWLAEYRRENTYPCFIEIVIHFTEFCPLASEDVKRAFMFICTTKLKYRLRAVLVNW